MKQRTYTWVSDQIKAQWLDVPGAVPGTRLPTERHLQEHFGVSRATISKAMALLTQQGRIRSRVGSGAYIAEAIPVPVAPAQRFIGYISPYPVSALASRRAALAVDLFQGIERRAREAGFSVLSGSADQSIEREEMLVEQFVRLGAEGIVLYPVDYPGMARRAEADKDYLAVRWRDTPIVLVDNSAEIWNRPRVLFDNYRLGYEMTQALIKAGRRHIVFMHTASERLHNAIHDRQRGWEIALQQAKCSLPETYQQWPLQYLDYGPALEESDVAALAERLLNLEPRPDAIIAWEDVTAIQLMLSLQERGVRIPEEILVCGFDNLEVARYFPLAFPTSDADFCHMGEWAIDALLRLMNGEAATNSTYILPAPLLWRTSDAFDLTLSAYQTDAKEAAQRQRPLQKGGRNVAIL